MEHAVFRAGGMMVENARWGMVVWTFQSDCIEDDRSRLADAIAVAREWTGDLERVVCVVLEQDRPWWGPQLTGGPLVIEQPFDRGSGPAVWAGAFAVAQQNAVATVRLFGRVSGTYPVATLVTHCESQLTDVQPYSAARARRPGANTLDLDALYPFVPRVEFESMGLSSP